MGNGIYQVMSLSWSWALRMDMGLRDGLGDTWTDLLDL